MSLSDVPARTVGPPLDLSDLIWPADYPQRGECGKPALIFDGRSTTYGALDRQASSFVTVMRAHGIAAGDRIAYLGRNSDVFWPAVFGCLRGGFVLVPLNWRYAGPEIALVMGDCESKLVICDAEFCAAVAAAAGPGMTMLVTDGAESLRDMLESAVPAERVTHDADAPAMLIYTSGTTGPPKGVCISHRMFALARHAEIISPDYAGWRSDDVVLSPMPNFHMGGLSWMLGAFCRGLTCVLTGDASPKAVLCLARTYGIARVFIVPTVIRGLLEDMRAQGVSLPALKEIHYGAAPMDAVLLRDCIDKLGCQFVQHYGMTENAGSATRLGPADHDLARPHLLRSVGKPQAGLTLEIRQPDGALAQRGQAGEIWLQSPTVMQGYWFRPEATRDVLVDGWYRTGDGGVLDAEGYLYLTDRIKDMVVSGGENIYPAEVEAALRQHEAVKDVAVFGMPDPRWGEIVAAALEFHEGQWASEEQLASHVRARIASYKVPKRFLLGVTLPRTAMGKTQRGEARKRALAAQAQEQPKETS